MKRNLFLLIHSLYIAILIKSCYLKQCFIKIKTLLNRGSSYLSTIYRLPVFPRQKKDSRKIQHFESSLWKKLDQTNKITWACETEKRHKVCIQIENLMSTFLSLILTSHNRQISYQCVFVYLHRTKTNKKTLAKGGKKEYQRKLSTPLV